jgi:hypothetical protein
MKLSYRFFDTSTAARTFFRSNNLELKAFYQTWSGDHLVAYPDPHAIGCEHCPELQPGGDEVLWDQECDADSWTP